MNIRNVQNSINVNPEIEHMSCQHYRLGATKRYCSQRRWGCLLISLCIACSLDIDDPAVSASFSPAGVPAVPAAFAFPLVLLIRAGADGDSGACTLCSMTVNR